MKGNCNYLEHKWKIKNSPLCDCGQIQSIKHIVEECPQTRYKGGIEGLPRAMTKQCSNEAFKYIISYYYYYHCYC